MTNIVDRLLSDIRAKTNHRLLTDGQKPLLTIVFNTNGFRLFRSATDLLGVEYSAAERTFCGCRYAIRPQKELFRVVER